MKQFLTGIAAIYVFINLLAFVTGISLYESLAKVSILLGLGVTLLIILLIINFMINGKVDLVKSLKELIEFIIKGIIVYIVVSIGSYIWYIQIEGVLMAIKNIVILLTGFLMFIFLFIYEANKKK